MLVALACLLSVGSNVWGKETRVLLATTTSVRDSGLLDAILPELESASGIRVQVVAVGSGAALRMGAEGNADLLFTHAPEGEEALVRSGAVTLRSPFLENHFTIAGPAGDPAGVADALDAADALRRIARLPAPYVSRGDDSGTHRAESRLLVAAGLPAAGGWEGFSSTGAGMGLTLQVAGERRAYVLSDLGTFLAFRERTKLVGLSKRTPDLRNVYSILRVSSEKFPKRIRAEAAATIDELLRAPATLERIGRFGVDRFGEPLFRPIPVRSASE